MDDKKAFGTCECGGALFPVWFKEEEYESARGTMRKTGRYRQACSHLECSICFRKVCVDDSFDGPWQTEYA